MTVREQQTAKPETASTLLDWLSNLNWNTHRSRLIALLSLLVLILVAPVWTVHYPPLIDFPNHLASAFVLAHLKDPRYQFSHFYASNWNTGPYLTMDLILVTLIHFLPVMMAGRIFLSLCLIAMPLAVWFFLREANPGEESLAFWSLLLCNNVFFFLYGFLNLQLSFAICFFALGLWIRYLNCPRAMLWWSLLVTMMMLYFTHILGFGMAGLIITLDLVLTRRSASEMLRSWALFLPGTIFYLYWSAHDSQKWPVVFRGFSGKVQGFVAIMLGYSHVLDFVTLLAIVGCILLAIVDNGEFRWNRRWIAILTCLVLVYAVFPANYGPGKMADRRLLPFLFVVALAGAKVGQRKVYLVPVALLLFLFRTGKVETIFVSSQRHLENLAQSFSIIPPNARVLPFVLHRTDNPMAEDHFWAYGVIDQGWFSPALFHDKGVQPFRIKIQTYAPRRSPIYISFRDGIVKWPQIQKDYDYVWAYKAPEFAPRLTTIGTLVFTSDDLRVYRLKR